MNRYEIETPIWQALLGRVLADYMVGKGFDLAPEALYIPENESGSVHQLLNGGDTSPGTQSSTTTKVAQPAVHIREEMEAVILTRRRDQPDFFPADGLDYLSRHNLLLFNPQPLEPAYLHQMTDCFWSYARFPEGKVRPSRPAFMIISPFATQKLGEMSNLKPIMPGVYEYNDLLSHFMVLIIDQLLDIPENLLWFLFSFNEEKVTRALNQYVPNRPEGKLNLPTLAELYTKIGLLKP